MLLAKGRVDLRFAAIIGLVGLLILAIACGNNPAPGPVIDEAAPVPPAKAAPANALVPPAKPEAAVAPVPPAKPEAAVAPVPPAKPEAADTYIIYNMGIFQEPSTRNYWNYFGGTGGDVWTAYVLDGIATTLYDYSHQRFDWVPLLADGFPSPLIKETIGGEQYWTAEVKLKKNAYWSDGEQITAADFVFVVDTALDMELGNNFYGVIDPDFLSHVEAVSPHVVKVYFYAEDPDGEPLSPGMSVWQFGLGFAPILPEHYWGPVVAQAKQAGDIASQQEALFSHIPENEPTANGFVSKRWEASAFVENVKAKNWWREGTKVFLYENGAYREDDPSDLYDVTYYGDAVGPISLEIEIGPHVDSEIFNVYSSQDAAILALQAGEIDYVFNPLGLERGLQNKIKSAPDLEIVTNPANKVRYLGFNTRKEPFNIKGFREAVATLIDKEFVTGTLLQGSAFPAYSMVPEGNGAWHNPDVARIGEGLNRTERLEQAVALLKRAGFTYDVEPQMSEDGNYVEVAGEGLRMPSGQLMPELEILAPSSGYDPMRSTFAIWIERWLNDAGIPTKAKLTGFGVIVDTLFSENVESDLDMWIMGWSLSLFPDYMEAYFHSRNIEDGVNWGGYSNPKFDALAKQFLNDDTIEASRTRVLEMQEFLAEDLPYVVLFTPELIDAYRPTKLRFPYTNALGGIEFINGLHRTVQID